MKHKKLFITFLIMIAAFALTAAAAGCSASKPAAAAILQLTGATGNKSFTLDQIKALPVTEGWGGNKSSAGVITVPASFKGVALKDVVAAITLAPWHPNLQIDSVKANRQSLHPPGPLAFANHIPTPALWAHVEPVQGLHPNKDIAASPNLSSGRTVTLGNTKHLMQ